MGLLGAVYSTFVFVLVLSVSVADDEKYICTALSGCVSDIIIDVVAFVPITRDPIPNEGNFGEFCRKTEIATKCIREHKDECEATDVLNEVYEIESEAVYLCREDIRQETLAIIKLECYKKAELRLAIRSGINHCNSIFMQRTSAVDCEQENKRAKCIVIVGNGNKCGADYIRYVIRRETDAVREKLGCPLFKV